MPIVDDTYFEKYLEKYGYLDDFGKTSLVKTSSNLHQRQPGAITKAIRSFQEFAHLPVTGKLDEATKKRMLAPRCGVSDLRMRAGTRFYGRWNKNPITWALVQPTSQIDSVHIRRAIQQSLNIWSQHIPLNFTEVQPQPKPDMQFSFHAGAHGDYQPFDGPKGDLAHAFYPEDGRVHFDDDEKWTFEDGAKIKQNYTDLLSITIHEIGHSLGLPHSNDPGAIMNDVYEPPDIDSNGQVVPFKLSQYDIRDIQAIYGPRQRSQLATPQRTPSVGPFGFQAVMTGVDGPTDFIGGNNKWTKFNAANAPANSAINNKFYVHSLIYLSLGLIALSYVLGCQ